MLNVISLTHYQFLVIISVRVVMLIFLFSLMLWQGYQTPCVNIKPDLILTVISVIAKKFNNTIHLSFSALQRNTKVFQHNYLGLNRKK